MLTKRKAGPRSLPSLRRFLLMWFLGGAVLIVVIYTALLEYYLDLGLDLRTGSLLLKNVEDYVEASKLDKSQPLPSGLHLRSYLSFEAVPAPLRKIFSQRNHRHGGVLRHANRDYGEGDDDTEIIDSGTLCGDASCEFIFFYPYQLGDDSWLYLVQGVVNTEQDYDDLKFSEQVAFTIGAVFSVLFLLLSLVTISRIGGPLGKLERWAERLDTNPPTQDVPDLSFREYDSLAQRLGQAFERIGEDAEREKQFLRHASHELRTPIAILSSNLELMERLTERPDRSDAEADAFKRQYHALHDIQQMTDTLLWINRQSDASPVDETVDLEEVVDSVVAENRYLIAGQNVDLAVDSQQPKVCVPAVALRIVVSNLVRNAMQYTVAGEIRISLSETQIVVENSNTDSGLLEPAQSDGSYGFGLGLDLVERICGRIGWTFEIQESADGYHVCISLSGKQSVT